MRERWVCNACPPSSEDDFLTYTYQAGSPGKAPVAIPVRAPAPGGGGGGGLGGGLSRASACDALWENTKRSKKNKTKADNSQGAEK